MGAYAERSRGLMTGLDHGPQVSPAKNHWFSGLNLASEMTWRFSFSSPAMFYFPSFPRKRESRGGGA